MTAHAVDHDHIRVALLLVADSLEKLAHRTDLNTDALANGNREVLEALGKNNRLMAEILAAFDNDRSDTERFQSAVRERLDKLERKAASVG